MSLPGPFPSIGRTLNLLVQDALPFDVLTIPEMYGKIFVQDLISCIPQSGIAKVLAAYLNCELSTFPPDTPVGDEDTADSDHKIPTKLPTEDVLDEMIVFALSISI